MKVSQVIDIFDDERPNSVKADIKLRWLRQIEQKVKEEIVDTHEPDEEPTEDPSDEEKDYFDGWGMDFELYIPEEDVDVYVKYLDQKTCQKENDMKAYNVASALFNANYLEFYNAYNRAHMPKQVQTPWFDHSRS